MAPAFTHRRIGAYAGTMAELAERAQAALADGGASTSPTEMMRLTLAIVGKTLFDADVADEADEVGAAMTAALRGGHARCRRLPSCWVPTRATASARRAIATLDAIIYRLIAARRAAGVDLGDVLSTLVPPRTRTPARACPTADPRRGGDALPRRPRDHRQRARLELLPPRPPSRRLRATRRRVARGARRPRADMEDMPRLPTRCWCSRSRCGSSRRRTWSGATPSATSRSAGDARGRHRLRQHLRHAPPRRLSSRPRPLPPERFAPDARSCCRAAPTCPSAPGRASASATTSR